MAYELNSPEAHEEMERQHLSQLDRIVGADLPPRPYIRSKDLFFDEQMERGDGEDHDYRSQEEELAY